MIHARLPLRAVPQGSASAFMPKGAKRPIVTSANRGLKPYRRQAATLLAAVAPASPIAGPVEVQAVFRFARAPSHLKKDGTPRSSAPAYPGHREGDVDKLCRSLLDALTDAGWIEDDRQVVRLHAAKVYGDTDEVLVWMSERP